MSQPILQKDTLRRCEVFTVVRGNMERDLPCFSERYL